MVNCDHTSYRREFVEGNRCPSCQTRQRSFFDLRIAKARAEQHLDRPAGYIDEVMSERIAKDLNITLRD